MDKKDIANYLNENKQKIINDISKLVKIPSIRDESDFGKNKPFGTNIRKAFDELINIAKQNNFIVEDFDGYAIHIEYGEGNEIVGVLTHIDIVPIYNLDLWETNPFIVCEKDGFLFGRGVNDNKGPTIGILYAFMFLRSLNIKPKRKIRLIVGGAEETTWECVKHYFSKNEQPKFAFSPDGNFPIINGEKGILYFNIKKDYKTLNNNIHNITKIKSNKNDGFVCNNIEITFYTKNKQELLNSLKNYSELNEISNNEILVKYENEITLSRNTDRVKNSIFNLTNDLINIEKLNTKGEALKNLLVRYFNEDYYAKKFNLYKQDNEMGTTTLCIMYINFDEKSFEINFDYRYPKGIDKNHILKTFKDFAKKEDLSLSIYKDLKLLYVNPDNPLIEKLSNAYKKVFGTNPELLSKGAASYARALNNGIVFGPTIAGDITNTHKANENISLNTLFKAIEVYIYALYYLAYE